jgi:hypothetical protein
MNENSDFDVIKYALKLMKCSSSPLTLIFTTLQNNLEYTLDYIPETLNYMFHDKPLNEKFYFTDKNFSQLHYIIRPSLGLEVIDKIYIIVIKR